MGNALRLRFLSWALLGAWALLVARAGQVQLVQHARWEEEARRSQSERERIPARRGQIRATDGAVLAHSVSNWSIAVDPSRVRDAHALATALDSLDLAPAALVYERLAEFAGSRFAWLNRDILPETRIDDLRARFPELIVRSEGKRLYPSGRAGGPVIGVLGRDETPLGGLESLFDAELRGRDGREIRVSDATREHLQGFQVHTIEEPVAGHDLEITIHPRMQEIALARLEAGVAREGAARGFCVITRPQTGEILALVQVPGADPADPSGWNGPSLRALPITDALEPGSSYKLVAFAAAIEAGLFDPDEMVNCMNGSRPMPGGRPITDHHPIGVVPFWVVLAHSSNIGTGLLAERAGAQRFYQMERALGFGLPTGISLPGEGRGRVAEPETWSARSLATMAFGQEISCTALQMAMAYGVVANGGNLMKPLLVRAVRDPNGTVSRSWDPEVVRPVLRPAAAHQLAGLLRRVVTDGTGKKAEIERLRPAGKTSTAQKYIPEEGSYSSRRYVASFVGFAPYDDPQVVCLVLLDEPTSSIYGGNVAAPLFREIVSDIWPFIDGEGVPHEGRSPVRWVGRERDERRAVPAVEGLEPALAGRVVRDAGFLPRLVGAGERVIGSVPAAGERCLPGSVISIRLQAEGDSVAAAPGTMPDLRGLALRDALLRVRSAGARPVVAGAGWVLTQTPEPGADVAPGQVCFLSAGPDSSRAYMEFLESERRAAWAITAGLDRPEPAR